MATLYINGFGNTKISIDEKHNYYLNGEKKENSISTTTLLGLFAEYNFSKGKQNFYIYKKIFEKVKGRKFSFFFEVQRIVDMYMDERMKNGTERHKQIEQKTNPKFEKQLNDYFMEKGFKEFRELSFYLENEILDLSGTIDLVLINFKEKKATLIDFKFSNGDKKKYLEKQLNLYAAVLKLAGIDDFKLRGMTIKDNGTIKIDIIKNLDFDITSILKTIKIFKE